MGEPSLGDRIRTCREARGWTQGKLAGRLGVDVSTVSRMESGVTRRFDDRLLRRLEKIFGVSDIRRAGVAEAGA